jgi:TolB protein
VKFPGTNTGAAFSPDGSRLAMTCSKDGNPELYVSDVRGGGARRLTRTRGTESSPTWSPDGGEIIYVSDDAGAPQLYRISAGGGSGSRLNTGFGYCTEPNWSPDGQKLAFNVRGGGGFAVAVLNLTGGGAHVVSGGGNAEDPTWGADSRHLVYSDGETIWLLDTVSGKKTRVAGGLGRVSEPTMSR